MQGTASEYWGARAAEYDDFIRRVVPRYDELTTRLLESLPPSSANVLELGCGTGNVSLRLVDALPGARFTFVDAAPEMVDVVRARVESVAPELAARSRFVVARFESLPAQTAAYDLVVASLSLHHVAELAPVYGWIGRSLRQGGELRNADGIRAGSPAEHARNLARWESFWQGRLSEDEIASVKEHITQHDHYETLADHWRMQADAGLGDSDCLWRDGVFALLSARRT